MPEQTGLPPAPEGTVRAEGPQIIPYGSVGVQSYGQNQPDLDPMKKPVVQQVVDAARKRMNEYIRNTFAGDQRDAPIYQPHEELPMLMIVMEAADFTIEPRRTDALVALKEQMVDVATSRPIEVLWERSRHRFVPWETRSYPVKIVIQLMQQLKNYIYSEKIEDTEIHVDPQTGRKNVVLKELAPHERVQIGFMKFRDPTPEELASKTDHSSRFNAQVTQVTSAQGGQPLMVNLDPAGNRIGNKDAVATVSPDGSKFVNPGDGTVSTSMAPDKTLKEAPSTPDDAVTDSTKVPQTNAAANSESGLPAPQGR